MIGIIPARSGSKRFPGKNRKDFFGKTLLERTIQQALDSQVFEVIVVSSDDPIVCEIANKYSVDIDYRPPTLAQDTTRVVEVVKYLLKKPKYSHITSMSLLFLTSPFRKITDIINAKKRFDEGYDSLFTITKYPVLPQFALEKKGAIVEPWYSSDFFLKVTTKQLIPPLYYPNYMIQMSKTSVVNENNGFLGDNCAWLEIDPKYAVDIDTLMDYEWAKFLVNEGHVVLEKY